ncbi:hypothetical protein ONZ45_g8387 [Pleurotus djamor]|nr:hypothetical protein ONZ45_g8387 [Pleurotus djamor]
MLSRSFIASAILIASSFVAALPVAVDRAAQEVAEKRFYYNDYEVLEKRGEEVLEGRFYYNDYEVVEKREEVRETEERDNYPNDLPEKGDGGAIKEQQVYSDAVEKQGQELKEGFYYNDYEALEKRKEGATQACVTERA